MLTELEIKQILQQVERFPCDHCKHFMPQLVDTINHYKGLSQLYLGELNEVIKEFQVKE